MVWFMVSCFEMVLVLFSLVANVFFTLIVHSAKSLKITCRGFLYMFSFSMFLMTISHGLTVFEFLIEPQTYHYLYFSSTSARVHFWRFIHEIGYALQSMSLLMFSIERLISSAFANVTDLLVFKVFLSVCTVISVLICIVFSFAIHFQDEYFGPTIIIDVVDFLSLLLLIVAWRTSLKKYSVTVGTGLESRYQLSEIYKWTRTFFPGAVLGCWCKLIAAVSIWILILKDYKDNEAGHLIFMFNNTLNLYSLVLPILIYSTSKRVQRSLKFQCIRTPSFGIETLEGKPIQQLPTAKDYFDNLRETWKL